MYLQFPNLSKVYPQTLEYSIETVILQNNSQIYDELNYFVLPINITCNKIEIALFPFYTKIIRLSNTTHSRNVTQFTFICKFLR